MQHIATAEWWKERASRIAIVVVAVAAASRVVALMIETKTWFFSIDFWEFYDRNGWGDLFAPHQDHLQVPTAFFIEAADTVVHLDFWPVYPIPLAFAWPAIGVAAFVMWRRRGVSPLLATIGSVSLIWLASAAWMSESHFGGPLAIVLILVAVDLEDQPTTVSRVVGASTLSLLAILTSTIGAIAVLARAPVAFLHRKWAHGAGLTAVLGLYLVWRMISGTVTRGFSIGELPAAIGHALRFLGTGLAVVVPWPDSLTPVLGGLAIGVWAVALLLVSRGAYLQTVLVATAGLYVLSVSYARFVFGFATPHPRFANTVLVLLIVATVPLLKRVWTMRNWRTGLAAGLAVILLIQNVGGSLREFDQRERAAARSAADANALVRMLEDGEPTHGEDRRLTRNLGPFFTLNTLRRLSDDGTVTLLSSDIFRQDIPHVSEEPLRGVLRVHVWPSGTVEGTWASLGVPDQAEPCRLVDGTLTVYPMDAVRIRLDRTIDGATNVALTWIDHFGVGLNDVAQSMWDHPTKEGSVFLTTARPQGDAILILTVDGPPVEMCLEG